MFRSGLAFSLELSFIFPYLATREGPTALPGGVSDVSIHPQVSAVNNETGTSSVIENEIPAYRAVSASAVVCLVMGILSLLCFIDYWFLILAGLTILTGVLAIRAIDRMPDALTGKPIAQAGIALALVFSFSSVTFSTTTYYLRANQAKIFAMKMQDVLNRGTLDEAMFYFQTPENRKTSSPEKMAEIMPKSGAEAEAMGMQFTSLKDLKKVLATKDSDFHFEEIERVADDGASIYASAIFETHSPNAPAPFPKEANAFVLLKGKKNKGKYEWLIAEVRYPYNREGFVIAEKKADDGHGH